MTRWRQQRLRLQPVQRRHLAGQRSQRRYLDFFFLRHFFQTVIARLELFLLRPHLIEAHGLHQHAAIRARHPGDAQHADQRSGEKYLGVVQGNGNLAELAFGVSGHKKYVEALAQNVSPLGTRPEDRPQPGSMSRAEAGLPRSGASRAEQSCAPECKQRSYLGRSKVTRVLQACQSGNRPEQEGRP